MAPILDIALIALLLAIAAWAILARDGFAATVGFVTFGLLLALAWVRVAAPDVALTEAAVGSGLTGGLLLAATTRLRGEQQATETRERPGTALIIAAAVASAAVAVALAGVVLTLPEPAPTLAPAAAAGLPAVGLGNAVTGVLMAYRAIDTLLEKVVLVLALLAVWSLAPDRFWGGAPWQGMADSRGGPLRLLAQVLPPLGIVIGVHLLWVGATAPGGAFQGGTVLAAMWVLAMLAALVRPPTVGQTWLRRFVLVGPALFLLVALAGLAVGVGFLGYPPSIAKPLIIAIEVALTLSIAAIMAMLVAGPPARMRAE
jgi:multisubunit Na+/H+ antiporter MnhB subunit